LADLAGVKAAARWLRGHRLGRFIAVGIALLALAALLVPLAVADILADSAAPSQPSRQVASTAAPNTAVPSRGRHRGRSARTAALLQATLTIAPGAPTTAVPSSFFGISTEYWGLPLFERNTAAFERVISLLHVPGDGPLILRIGGDSADHSFWHRRWRPMPRWAFELTPRFLARLKALVLRDRVKLIVDLNLVTDTPLTAAARARAAETSLPHGSITGFEIGNEPDLYSRHYWVATIARSPFVSRALPLELTPASYVQAFAAYARVLGENSPDIPLVGPAVAHPRVSLPFISTLIGSLRPEVGVVSGHLYPYSACTKSPRSNSYPTVAKLLSRQATSAFATDITSAVATAHRAGLPFRLTEFNSVTCGGKPGVSNTFASALWAPDALFTAMRTGVDGTNLHVRANAINAAFTINRSGLVPRPLLYGLMMFTRTLGPQARLVRLHLAAARSLNLSAWAVQIRGHVLHVLMVDKGSRTVRVDLRLPAAGAASVQRLLADSPYSRSGVTLNGQQLNSAAKWTGTPRSEAIPSRGRAGYVLTLPRRSAALIAVRLTSSRGAGPPARRRSVSEHHRRAAVTQHAVLAVGLHRSRKH
jgi:hypothetical protein